MGRDPLEREIAALEGQLASQRVIDELATVRRGLATRAPAFELPNVRLAFACKQRWEDMTGDDRVRACNGCDRPVFNLSQMTRDEAAAVLAMRGLTPCVRFYRRPDGTVMTSDCPTGTRPERRRLAVVASSLAAGTVLAAASPARAEPVPVDSVPSHLVDPDDDPPTEDPAPAKAVEPIEVEMGVPMEMGVITVTYERPRVEWSMWGRLGAGVASRAPSSNVIARRLTPAMAESSSTGEAAAVADVTIGLTRTGDVRAGAWGEISTLTGAVAGGELVIEGLPPHPYDSRIGGTGSIVLRAGGNAHAITTELGFGYTGSWPNYDPWVRWAQHLVGARVVGKLTRSIDDPRDWSATIGIEVEPIGLLHALINAVKP